MNWFSGTDLYNCFPKRFSIVYQNDMTTKAPVNYIAIDQVNNLQLNALTNI